MINFLRKITPDWIIKIYHYKMAVLANIWCGFPARKMRIFGITGTNGKTTTCFLLASILRESGKKVGMLTTVRFQIGDKTIVNKLNMTTVNPFMLQKYLKQMLQAGCTDVVLETTSHAIDQYRVWGIPYFAVGITNVTHEHLDYHKSMDEYAAVKRKIFDNHTGLAVLNMDDEKFSEFSKTPARRKIVYSIKHKDADIYARKVLSEPSGTLFTLVEPHGQQAIDLQLPGEFNVQNALCAAAFAYGLNLPVAIVKKGLENVKSVPGRMELVNLPEVPGRMNFSVIIDYAHTPDALRKVLETLRQSLKGKLITVYGATGDRDKSKRPILGSIGGKYADVVIITDEESYSEDPQAIIDQVASGVEKGATEERPKKLGESFFKIKNRMEAIDKAVSIAGSGDVVIITGMGDQRYKVVKGQKLPWSDREIVLASLRKRGDLRRKN